jgi:hypothetical protein
MTAYIDMLPKISPEGDDGHTGRAASKMCTPSSDMPPRSLRGVHVTECKYQSNPGIFGSSSNRRPDGMLSGDAPDIDEKIIARVAAKASSAVTARADQDELPPSGHGILTGKSSSPLPRRGSSSIWRTGPRMCEASPG